MENWKEIPLTQGKVAKVSPQDYSYLSKFKWCASYRDGKWMAMRREYLGNYNGKMRYMHRDIMGNPAGMEIDHINRDVLDNRRENLRVASRFQNARNIGMKSNNKSGYKGVSWDKSRRKWRATIVFNNKQLFLGRFDNPQEAAGAYDQKSIQLFGEFASPNFGGSDGILSGNR